MQEHSSIHVLWTWLSIVMLSFLALLALLDPNSIIPALCQRGSEGETWVDKDIKPYSPNNNNQSKALCFHPPSPPCKMGKPSFPKDDAHALLCCNLSLIPRAWIRKLWVMGWSPYSFKRNQSNKRYFCLLSSSCASWSQTILMDIWYATSAQYKVSSSMHIMRSICQILHNAKHIDIGDVMWWPYFPKCVKIVHAFS